MLTGDASTDKSYNKFNNSLHQKSIFKISPNTTEKYSKYPQTQLKSIQNI